MRQYANPAAFRAAVDARLRRRAREHGVEALVLRRRAALERLMARLTAVAPGRWAFKGGFALETLDPVLAGTAAGTWDPSRALWRKDRGTR
jgi:hypothetical protein